MKNYRMRAFKSICLICCASSALIASAPALAQTDDSSVGMADIIVTAQKREQSLQDVPIAITALSPDMLQANRVVSVMDLNALAPNLTLRNTAGGAGVPTFTLRGSVSYGSVAGTDRSISLYLDGVYLGNAYGSAFELPDVERIEVLRGPQGTLFGRNATAGAISIVTKDPSGEYGMKGQFTYGNYDQLRASVRVETPQLGPLSASFSYTHNERTGDMKNLGAGYVWDRSAGAKMHNPIGVSPKTLGDQNIESLFGAVKLQVSDAFKLVYKFDWMENNFTPEGNNTIALTPYFIGSDGDALALAYAANGVPLGDGSRPKAVNNFYTVPGYQRVQGHNLTGSWEVADHVSLKNILSYRKSYMEAFSDLAGLGALTVTPAVAASLDSQAGLPAGTLCPAICGSPYVAAGSSAQNISKQWSDELQLNYDSDLLTLTAGAMYFHMDSSTGSPDGLANYPVLTPIPGGVIPSGQRNISYNKAKSLAGYLQAELHVTPQLDVIGGYRLTRDRKSGTSYVYVNPTATTPGRQDTYLFDYKDTRSSYLLGVNYKPTQDMLLYAKFSTGFVSGGAVSGIPFKPETATSWEAGVKADLFNRRLRANLALFHVKYKNVQAVTSGANLPDPDTDLGTLVLAEGDVRSQGVELELTATPVHGLTLNGGVGYTDSIYTKENAALRPPGSMITERPKWTLNGAIQYDTQPVFGDAVMMFRLDANYRSKRRGIPQTFFPADYDKLLYSDALFLLNGRIALRDIDLGSAKAEIAIWGKNLTNSDSYGQQIPFFFMGTTSYERARTYGLDVSLSF